MLYFKKKKTSFVHQRDVSLNRGKAVKALCIIVIPEILSWFSKRCFKKKIIIKEIYIYKKKNQLGIWGVTLVVSEQFGPIQPWVMDWYWLCEPQNEVLRSNMKILWLWCWDSSKVWWSVLLREILETKFQGVVARLWLLSF